MPSKSKKQHNFMEAIAHNPAFAKKAGVSQKVGQEYSKADKGKTFRKGGIMGLFKGKETYKEELAEGKAIKSGKISPEQYAKAEGKEKKFAKGGKVKGYLGGGLLSGMINSGAFNATAGQPVAAVQPPGSTGPVGAMPKYGNGGGAQGGLDQVNQGSSQIGQSLGTIAGALGTGGSQGPSTPSMPYGGAAQTGFKKGGRVKKMAMGGAPMGAPVDPRMAAMMAKKKAMAPRGMMPPARGMMPPRPPMAAPQVAPTAPMKKGGKVKGQSPIQRQAKGGAKIVKMAKGGMTRGDGCCIRGKTRA